MPVMAASMRPRHKAAENLQRAGAQGHGAGEASMRPRHKAAENCARWRTPSASSASFNEAAA